ncbi:MAG: nucleoside-diphosphate sugar epimerase, partial [Candidatus Gygaella obscura]|nr:nucleoside-diphosphate sugar epimerase [Candidatus Gygaella obscura]
GSQEEISIKALAERVVKMAESSSKIDLIPYNEAYEEGFEDMQRRVPDVSKINSLVGFEPRFNLGHIIKEVIAYQSK